MASVIDDVFYFDSGMVRVVSKGDKERFMTFSRDTEALLQDWMAERRANPIDPPSSEAKGTTFNLSRAGIRELFRKIRMEADVPGPTPHVMRHTAATAMIANGMEFNKGMPFSIEHINTGSVLGLNCRAANGRCPGPHHSARRRLCMTGKVPRSHLSLVTFSRTVNVGRAARSQEVPMQCFM